MPPAVPSPFPVGASVVVAPTGVPVVAVAGRCLPEPGEPRPAVVHVSSASDAGD